MRTLALLFSLMLVNNVFAQNEAQPERHSVPVQIYPEDAKRTSAQVWVVSGEGIVCSFKDAKVESETFELKDKTVKVAQPTAALHCYSKGGANMGVALTGDINRSYTNSIQSISVPSVEVLPANPARVRGVVQSTSLNPIFCGYECPAKPTNGFYLVHPMTMDFRGTDPVCCSTTNGSATIVVSSEVQD